ncbi:transcription initiation at TATA-containing promoter protein [Microbotryomycetes sp. JL201]|nr:transcription initiation at TATA-containing promoter protein [Microbotryomycetes sp. JL201]
MSGPAFTAPVDQQDAPQPAPAKHDLGTAPQPASSAAPAPVDIDARAQAVPGLVGDSLAATPQPPPAPTSDVRTVPDAAAAPEQAVDAPAPAPAPVDADAPEASATASTALVDSAPDTSTPSVPEAAATLTQIASSDPDVNGNVAPTPSVIDSAPVHVNGTTADAAPTNAEQPGPVSAPAPGFASPAPASEPQSAAAAASPDIAAPVVEPAPISAPEVPPPPPVVPLPQQLTQRPPLVHVDSASSLAAQPPTPTVPGAASAAPSAAASLAAASTTAVNSATASPVAPSPSPAPAASAGEGGLPAAQGAEEVNMEDASAPSFAASTGGDVSPTTVLKRSAPEEASAAIDQSLGAEDRDAKRPRVDSEPSASAAVAEPMPTPVQGYDPLAFSAPQSMASAYASSASAPAPTMSPSEMYNALGSTPAFNPAAPAPTPAADGTVAAPADSAVPVTAPAAQAPATPIAVMTRDQQKAAVNLLRNLKRNRNAGPFLRPVDPVLQLIPDYPRVITKPMDLGTVEAKVMATGKAMTAAGKAGRVYGLDYSGTGQWEGQSDKVYRTADELKADLGQIWLNCFTYNGPPERHPVSKMAQEMKEAADKGLNSMPAAPLVDPTAPPPPPVVEKRDRRPSNSFVPTIRRSDDGARPKREIKTPAYDLPYDGLDNVQMPVSGKSRTGRVSGKSAQEQLRFCKEVIKELFKKVHEPYAFPFYEPVNYIALNIPQYPSIIKKPMDLGTVRTKLENGLYPLPPYAPFEADIRLIFRNCYTFNPPGTPVHEMGRRLEAVFDAKWEERPSGSSFEDEFSDDDGISAMQMQLANLQASIEQMKQNKRLEKERQRAAERSAAAYARPPKPPKRPSMDYGAPRPPSTSNTKRPKKPKKKRDSSDDEDFYDDAGDYYGAVVPPQPEETGELVTFEMKRELATKIVTFEGEALERAIDIIRQGMPALLGDANKEIELDIDQLDQRTLLTLYRFVCPDSAAGRPKAAKPRRNGSQPGPSKRKNLDEVKESERIEMLEARLREFEKQSSANQASTPGATGGMDMAAGGGVPGAAVGGQASSDSSSDEDSGSDSDDD